VHGVFGNHSFNPVGWTVSASPADIHKRCSLYGPPLTLTYQGGVFEADEYWQGNFLHLPGAGDEEMLFGGSGTHILGQTTSVVASSDGGAASTIANGVQYFPNGALKQFNYGNGIVHTLTQNVRQLPSRSTDGSVLDLGTTFDANGNVAGITDYTSGARQTRSMAYDQADRLASTTSPMFGTATYAYDIRDNLTQVIVSGGTAARSHYYCYNAANQLEFVRSGSNCASSPAVINLGYDVQGNVSSKTGTAGGTYTFDYGNRLRSTAGLTYRHDAEGRRVRQDTSGANLKYGFYSKDGKLRWQRDEPASKRISHLYLAGSLIAEYSRPIGITTPTITYQHTDAFGSPIAKTNSAGTVIETSEYEPYGKLLNRANDDRPGYTGHVMDGASGLTYMQQRYYDPSIGRFLSVDPVTASSVNGSNFNRYWYANNNPYKFVDPDGRFGHIAVGGGIGAVFGGGMEVYRQLSSEGRVSDWKAVGIETGKGAAVGALTAALPGSGLAFGGAGAKAAVSVGNAVAVGSAGEVAAQAAKGETIDTGKALMAGVANGVGLGAGKLAEPLGKAAGTTTVAGNPGFKVTSLRGREFTHGASPASSTVSEGVKQSVQDTAGAAASSAMEEKMRRK